VSRHAELERRHHQTALSIALDEYAETLPAPTWGPVRFTIPRDLGTGAPFYLRRCLEADLLESVRLAVHEAAHAIVAHDVGIRVSAVRLVADFEADRPRLRGGETLVYGRALLDDVASVVTTAAGRAAEKVFGVAYQGEALGRQDARDLRAILAPEHWDQAVRLGERLVRTRLPEVRAVAAALLRAGELDADGLVRAMATGMAAWVGR